MLKITDEERSIVASLRLRYVSPQRMTYLLLLWSKLKNKHSVVALPHPPPLTTRRWLTLSISCSLGADTSRFQLKIMLIILLRHMVLMGDRQRRQAALFKLAGCNFHPSGFYRVSSCIQIRSAPFSNMLNPFQAILSCTVSIDDAPKV